MGLSPSDHFPASGGLAPGRRVAHGSGLDPEAGGGWHQEQVRGFGVAVIDRWLRLRVDRGVVAPGIARDIEGDRARAGGVVVVIRVRLRSALGAFDRPRIVARDSSELPELVIGTRAMLEQSRTGGLGADAFPAELQLTGSRHGDLLLY
jgi:hypothetical protein